MKVNNEDKEYKSSTKKYWIAWFILMAVNLLCTIFKIYPEEYFDIILFVIFFILMALYCVYYVKLMNYLEKNHFEKWIELTDFSFFKMGFDRQFRMNRFFKSKETLNDPIVAKLKSEVDSTGLLLFVHAGSGVIFFLSLFLLALVGIKI